MYLLKLINLFLDEKRKYFAFVTRHPLASQYSSSGVIESLNDLYLDLKSFKLSITPEELY